MEPVIMKLRFFWSGLVSIVERAFVGSGRCKVSRISHEIGSPLAAAG
jgi:hypothetical protein